MDSKKKGRRLGAAAWILAVGLGMSVVGGMGGTLASASQLDNGGFCVKASSDQGEFESIAGRCEPAPVVEQPDMALDEGASWITPFPEDPGMLEFAFMVKAQPDRFVRIFIDGKSIGGSYTSSKGSWGNTVIFRVMDSEQPTKKVEACYGDANDAAKRSGCVVLNLANLL